jgi:kynurenine 3-monooxygenase
MAILLAKLGLQVDIYEKRVDPNVENADGIINSEFGTSTSAVKRSINLALSYRGIMALNEVGIVETVLEHAIKMPRRVIHSVDKAETEQMYGTKDDTL